MIRKIEAMHQRFGIVSDKRCGDCSNLIEGRYRTRYLRKCSVYGVTHSEASDWRKKYVACGLFNQEWKGQEMMKVFQWENQKKNQIEPLEGQVELEL